MNREDISIIIYNFVKFLNIRDNDYVEYIISNNIDSIIDRMIIILDKLLKDNIINFDDFLNGCYFILCNSKYKKMDDIINRLYMLKCMNMENAKMSLKDNHKLVLDVFNEFNCLTNNMFDCFYTGGLVSYIGTCNKLVRYHDDIDLFFNEDELFMLMEIINNSKKFSLISCLEYKSYNGHEYRVIYKNSSISIGLILFKRTKDREIVLNNYYYEDGDIYVDEEHLRDKYVDIMFDNNIYKYRDNYYKRVSLESIYNNKKYGRVKDRYDASNIINYVDLDKECLLDEYREYNYSITHKYTDKSKIKSLERVIGK